ncbi:MAG: Lrp/AsnC family transcriptional regulator [Pseudonocardiales bacterium]|nr:Lrp/AsnC family transcriptional regulator [Pseudonocardiales bacterium]
MTIDKLDAQLLGLLRDRPRIGLVEVAKVLGVARGTVQARLEKLQHAGVVTGFGPDIDVRPLGFPILALVTIELQQGRLEDAITILREVPEVLEVYGTTGPEDLICRVATRDTEHLQSVLGIILASHAVQRTSTHIMLTEQIAYRTGPLVELAARGDDG